MKLWAKIRALVRRRTLEREMAEEMRVHLEMLAERKRAEGMSGEEAKFAARPRTRMDPILARRR